MKQIIKKIYNRFLLYCEPRVIPNKAMMKVFGRPINWDQPKNLIEKIYWLQLYSNTSAWTKCADKYLVRDYVKGKGCGQILNTLYGKWDDVHQIDWDTLPKSFVLKTNNSCGKVIIVKDKNEISTKEIEKELDAWLNSKYGYHNAQLHYTKIKPCIIAEKLLFNEENPRQSLIDYKIWCFNGVPESVLVVYNRTNKSYLLTAYDMDWKNITETALNKNLESVSGAEVQKPKSFEDMIHYAKILSKGFPQVRIDFYDIRGEVVFGEMTFSTGFGYYTDEYYDYLGSKIDLKNVKKLNRANRPN